MRIFNELDGPSKDQIFPELKPETQLRIFNGLDGLSKDQIFPQLKLEVKEIIRQQQQHEQALQQQPILTSQTQPRISPRHMISKPIGYYDESNQHKIGKKHGYDRSRRSGFGGTRRKHHNKRKTIKRKKNRKTYKKRLHKNRKRRTHKG